MTHVSCCVAGGFNFKATTTAYHLVEDQVTSHALQLVVQEGPSAALIGNEKVRLDLPDMIEKCIVIITNKNSHGIHFSYSSFFELNFKRLSLCHVMGKVPAYLVHLPRIMMEHKQTYYNNIL